MTSLEMTFNGMTVEQGFQHVLSQLKPADIECAIKTEHEGWSAPRKSYQG